MTPHLTESANMNTPPKRPFAERDEFEEPPVKMREKCCWCGQMKRLVDRKPYCALCKSKGKECRRCHRPMPEAYFNLSSDYCRSCVNVKQSSTSSRAKFAIDGLVSRYEMEPNDNNKWDLLTFFSDSHSPVHNIVEKDLEKHKGVKYYLALKVKFVKFDKDGEEMSSEPFFQSKPSIAVNSSDINIDEHFEQIERKVIEFLREGSGWAFDHVIKLYIKTVAYNPLDGRTHIKLSKYIADKKAVLNINNRDNKCFLWSVLAALHPVNESKGPQRVHHYRQYENELNLNGISFPVDINQIEKFEKQNNLSINVIGYESTLFPIYTTKNRSDNQINLLLISQGEKRHFCLVRNMSRLLADRTNHNGAAFYCNFCFHGFVRQDLLDEHLPYCKQHGAQKIELPDEENKWLRFENFRRQLKTPFVIYADFESITKKIIDPSIDSNTKKYQEHEACGYAYKVVCEDSRYSKPIVHYRGPDPINHFLNKIFQEEQEINKILENITPMDLTPQDEINFKSAKNCHICDKPLGANRVRDHNHLSGAFRGAAHSECNLNFKFLKKENKYFLPICFHNLRGYDSHMIIKAMGKTTKRINVIPNNMEKYISFSLGNIRFIDSLQFLGASLDKLVSNMLGVNPQKCSKCDGKLEVEKFTSSLELICICNDCNETSTQIIDKTKLIHTTDYSPDKAYLLARKGVYPYDYMDSWERFDETLPAKEEFFSQLYEEGISEKDYTHAKHIWSAFNCKNMGEYHDLYLCTDVLLLADVFENFRNLCLNQYKLDPCQYFTAPGLFWDAMLKVTDIELELLTDIDQHLFIENNIRGGIAMISNRYSQANNPYLNNYDSSKDTSYIISLDCNNLYGTSMEVVLPEKDFNFLTEEQINKFDVLKISDNSELGYIIEADINYPHHLHNTHNSYPLLPESIHVDGNMISPYSRALLEKLHLKLGKNLYQIYSINNATFSIIGT